MRRCLWGRLLALGVCVAGCAGQESTVAVNHQAERGGAAGPIAAPAAQSAGRPVPFAERGECDLAAAVADIRGTEFAEWGTVDGPPDSLSLKRAWKIGSDANDQPDVLVTVHTSDYDEPEIMRFYGMDGKKLMPQVELISEWGPFEPLNHFKHRRREFIIVWGHSGGSAGGGPQWVLCKSGSHLSIVPYDNPAEKTRHLLGKGEAGGSWYLNEGSWEPNSLKPDRLSFAYYIWGPGDPTASPRAKVAGTFALEIDADALRFVFKDARREPLDGVAQQHPYLKPEERPAKT